MNIEEKVAAVVGALEDIKASDITALDTNPLNSLFERVVIAKGKLVGHFSGTVFRRGEPIAHWMKPSNPGDKS